VRGPWRESAGEGQGQRRREPNLWIGSRTEWTIAKRSRSELAADDEYTLLELLGIAWKFDKAPPSGSTSTAAFLSNGRCPTVVGGDYTLAGCRIKSNAGTFPTFNRAVTRSEPDAAQKSDQNHENSEKQFDGRHDRFLNR
jgi:hypothetical protein